MTPTMLHVQIENVDSKPRLVWETAVARLMPLRYYIEHKTAKLGQIKQGLETHLYQECKVCDRFAIINSYDLNK